MRIVSCKNAARASQSVILECSMPGVRDVHRQRLWSSVRHVTSPALGTAQRDDLPKPSVSGQSGSNGGQSDGRFVFSVTDSELAATASGPLIHPSAAAAYVMGRPSCCLTKQVRQPRQRELASQVGLTEAAPCCAGPAAWTATPIVPAASAGASLMPSPANNMPRPSSRSCLCHPPFS